MKKKLWAVINSATGAIATDSSNNMGIPQLCIYPMKKYAEEAVWDKEEKIVRIEIKVER